MPYGFVKHFLVVRSAEQLKIGSFLSQQFLHAYLESSRHHIAMHTVRVLDLKYLHMLKYFEVLFYLRLEFLHSFKISNI